MDQIHKLCCFLQEWCVLQRKNFVGSARRICGYRTHYRYHYDRIWRKDQSFFRLLIGQPNSASKLPFSQLQLSDQSSIQVNFRQHIQFNSDLISRYVGSCITPIATCLRASAAAPIYFEEYVSPDNERFQDGGLISNNPTAVAIHEARKLWPDRPIECVVSLGTGTHPILPQKKQAFLPGLLLILGKATTNSATIDNAIRDLLEVTGSNINYFRFNPMDEVFACELVNCVFFFVWF